MKTILAPFFSALRFLTIIDLPLFREDWQGEEAIRQSQRQFARSLIYYPIVGLLLGLLLAASYAILHNFMPLWLTMAIILALWVWLTGALHLDGFADCADGVAASHKDEQIRDRIMKESTVGAMAVIAVAILLLLKFAALIIPDQSIIVKALILTPMLSRWAMAAMVYIFPYKRQAGAGAMLKESKSVYVIIVPTLITLVISVLLAGVLGLVIMAIVFICMLLAANFYKSKLQGISGDTYGAVNEICEVVILAAFCIIAFNGWF